MAAEWPTEAMIAAGAGVLFRQSPLTEGEARELAECAYLAMEAAYRESEFMSLEELARPVPPVVLGDEFDFSTVRIWG